MSEPSSTAEARTAVREPNEPGKPKNKPNKPNEQALPDAEPRAEELLIEEISIDGMCGVY